MIQQSVLTIQIEMIFPVEIFQKTSDGPLQLLLIKLKVVLMKERKEKIFGTFGLIKNIQTTRQDVISTIVIRDPRTATSVDRQVRVEPRFSKIC